MKLLEGKKISEKILKDMKKKIKREKLKPVLAVVLVGDDKASEIYVKLKGEAAKKVGIGFKLFKFKKGEKESKIIETVKKLNRDRKISGIIVQLPLPKKFNTQKIINSMDPRKDADGFSAYGGSAVGGHPQKNIKISKNHAKLMPVFPHAIIKLVETSRVKLKGKKAVIIANSKKFGEVMRIILENKGIKADYVLAGGIKAKLGKIKSADIIISAVGKPGLIKGSAVKNGVIIIDGGITKKDKKVLGDVDFESVKKIAGYLTPVPGGVGPVTIACLLENVYLASKKQT